MESPGAPESGGELLSPQLVRCVVALAHRHVKLSVSERDTVGSLVELAKAKLHEKYPCEKLSSAVVGVRSVRLDEDLHLADTVGDVLQQGDVLQARPYTVATESDGETQLKLASSKQMVNALLLVYQREIGVSAKLGAFTVTPLEAEGNLFSRSVRVSLSVALIPYDPQTFVPPAVSPAFMWRDASVMIRHTDQTKEDLFVLIRVFDESPIGCKTCIAMVGVPLEEAVSCPGVTATSWISVDPVGKYAGQVRCGRIRVGVSFHSKVMQGPTISNLLKGLLSAAQQSTIIHDVKSLGKNSVSVFSSRSKPKKGKLQTLIQEPGKQKVLGQLKLKVRSVHLCTDECSVVRGHSTLQSQDPGLVIRITFADSVHELHLDPQDCNDVMFEHEWPVHSLQSLIQMEFLRKAEACRAAGKLVDGTSVAQVCSGSVSCLGIQVIQACQLTANPLPRKVAPSNAPPRKGYRWISLYHNDEECGLVEVKGEYKEDYGGIFSCVQSPDVGFIPAEEREFDPAIVQRNVERIEDLLVIFKTARLWYAETIDWKYPLRTVSAWIASTYLCLHVSPKDVPFFLVATFVACLLATLIQFRNGKVHKYWIEKRPGHSCLDVYRPVATLHFAVVTVTDVKPDGSQAPSALFVRVFYEPNYKNIPLQLVTQVECPQKFELQRALESGARPSDVSTTWFSSESESEGQSQEGDTECPRPDSPPDGTDTRTVQYRMLQPARINPNTGAEELIPWHESPSAIRFDVMQRNRSRPPLLVGRARAPIKVLVVDEKTGGAQSEQELELQLTVPIRSSSSTRSTATSEKSERALQPTLVARMQLIMRDPKTSTTLVEEAESEKLYSALEFEREEELTLIAKYRKAKDVAKGIQQAMGQLCSTMERVKNLIMWVHPLKTFAVLVLAFATCLFLWVIPVKYIIVSYIASEFTYKFHKYATNLVPLQNFLCSIPTDLDMRKIFHRYNQEFWGRMEYLELGNKFQADWVGRLWKSVGFLHSWKERYCVVRGGRLEYWEFVNDARTGILPKKIIVLANATGECSKVELAQLPPNAYPIVLFDLSSPSAPRRRVVYAWTKADREKLMDVIHATGHAFPIARLPSKG